MLPLALLPCCPPVLPLLRSQAPFSTARVVGKHYTSTTFAAHSSLHPRPFAPDVNVTVRNSYLAPPPLAVHRGACDDGATKIVRAVVAHSRLDALIHTASSLYSITTTLSTKASPINPIAVASSLPLRARARALQLVSAAPPAYGRLPGCPASPVEPSAGVVLDHGFVAARGARRRRSPPPARRSR